MVGGFLKKLGSGVASFQPASKYVVSWAMLCNAQHPSRKVMSRGNFSRGNFFMTNISRVSYNPNTAFSFT